MIQSGPIEHNQLVFPTSSHQQRVWLLNQLAPDRPLYNNTVSLRLIGPLNVPALQASINEIVRRHEILRTTFTTIDSQLVQVVAGALRIPQPVIDLAGLGSKIEETLARLIHTESRRLFDLAHGPLIRSSLLRLHSQEHVFLLSIHHIVFDGWSLGIIGRELAALYSAYAKGQPSPLAELSLQYADFAVWQRTLLQSDTLNSQLAYWQEQLTDLPIVELPIDRPRPAVQTFCGQRRSIMIPQSLLKQLVMFSQQEGVTLFMTALAVFAALLYRYTRQTDIVIGSPIANRTQAELEDLIGFFTNTLALRIDLSGNPTFLEALRQVRTATLDAYERQDLPFEKLVEALQPERDLSRSPLFQIMLVFQNAPDSLFELPGLTTHYHEIDVGIAAFDLTLILEVHAEGLRATAEYSTDLFDEATIERFLGHLHMLFEGAVADPAQQLADLPLLTVAERRWLLVENTRTQLAYPQDRSLPDLFEAQVARTPDAIAVVCAEVCLSYRALHTRAVQLACYLQARGVGPEVLVGFCPDRSLELVIGVLGILLAGGAYIPLDPTYPAERLSLMLSDSGARVLLTQAHILPHLPAHTAEVICLDRDWPVIAEVQAADLARPLDPENLAYVIYTSGSTGVPKGVAITHRSAVAFLAWVREIYSPTQLAGVLATTSICFDLSIYELFAPLSTGSTILMAEHAIQVPLLPAIGAATLLNSVPSAVAELVRMNALPPSVRTVNLAGEPLTLQLAQQLYQSGTVHQVFNLYGPTEDTTYSTYSFVPPDLNSTPTIGRPIANTQIYILDARLQPTPVGVPGELYIGGVGLARGYLGRPALTAERFIPNPFAPTTDDRRLTTDSHDLVTRRQGDKVTESEDAITPSPLHPFTPSEESLVGGRLYRTGDLARYRTDGTIEFLGRIDHQVKIRGFRIELGEIEAVLLRHPAVRECVVLAREDVSGDKRLVAYVVPSQEPRTKNQEPDSPVEGSRFSVLGSEVGELRTFLGEQVPAYMIPVAFVELEALPLTPNGKLDRRALPPPDSVQLNLEQSYVAPASATEEVLAGIWADTLGLEQIGIHDNFFALGGHSLLAMQAIAQISDVLRIDLPLRLIFEGPSVARLAPLLTRDPGTREKIEYTAALLIRLSEMSEEEAEQMYNETFGFPGGARE